MRPAFVALTFAALSIVWWPGSASAGEARHSDMKSIGVVTSVGPNTLTLRGRSGAGATFEQTVTIDAATTVYGKGASTAAVSHGGKAPFAALVAGGDRVSVWYHKQGDLLVASEVHVTAKAKH